MTFQRLFWISTVLLAAIAWLVLPSAAPVQATPSPAISTPAATSDDEDGRQDFMRRKLVMVNKIVEGITTENFDMVKDGARNLVTLAESAAWTSGRDPFYRHYSASFEQAAKRLMDAADNGSVEKATYAYVHVTFSCTACHQHVRNVVRLAD